MIIDFTPLIVVLAGNGAAVLTTNRGVVKAGPRQDAAVIRSVI
jgi:hypothetical protein